MKLRMRIDVAGTFHGNPEGVSKGDVVDIEDWIAERYVANGYAEEVTKSGSEKVAVIAVPEDEVEVVETATVDDDAETATKESTPTPKKAAPKALDDDESEDDAEAAKARVASKRASKR